VHLLRHAWSWLAVLIAGASLIAPGCATQAPAFIDRDLGSLIRGFIVDSLHGGGRAPNQVFAAADSSSADIMRIAGVAMASTTQLTCPGSTNAAGNRLSSVVGYQVTVAVTGEGRTRKVTLRKACNFVYRGRPSGFYEGLAFEVKRQGWHWRVSQWLEQSIT
jgi:hypothetical protein